MPTWIRVRDVVTGHEFDVDERSLPRSGVERVPDYPVLSGPRARPRPAKARTNKAGEPVQQGDAAAEEPETEQQTTRRAAGRNEKGRER